MTPSNRHAPIRATAVLAVALASLSQPVAAQPTANAPAPGAASTAPESTTQSTPVSAPEPVTEPSEQVKSEYRSVVGDAVTEHAAGNWAEARAFFTHAHELWPSARTFRTLGMTAYELKRYVVAARELESALADTRRALDGSRRVETRALLDKARAFVGRFTIDLSPREAALSVDGRSVVLPTDRVLHLNLGTHTLRASAPGRADAKLTITVQGREDETLTLSTTTVGRLSEPSNRPDAPKSQANVAAALATPATQPTASQSYLWTWIGAGTTVALGAAAVGLYFMDQAEFDDLKGQCDGCKQGDEAIDTGTYDTLVDTGNVLRVLTAVAAIGTVVAFVLESPDDSEAPTVALRISPGGAFVTGHF